MKVLFIIGTLVLCAIAQEYVEVEGQTMAFTLSAGATAAWDNPVNLTENSNLTTLSPVCDIKTTGSGFFIYNTKDALIKLYDIKGRLVASIANNQSGFHLYPAHISNGVFIARVEVDNKSTLVKKMVVLR